MAPQRSNPFGGQFVSACFLDGRPKELIFVRLLSPRFYPDLRRALEDEPTQAQIFTGRDASYIDLLRPESLEEVVILGWALNREHVNRNSSRILENTAEEAGIILEMIESFPPAVQDLGPEILNRYRKIAATEYLKSFPPSRSLTDLQVIAEKECTKTKESSSHV